METDAGLAEGAALAGRQGRELLCFLALRRDTPVHREEVAGALWGDRPPRAWDSALHALVSKLRRALSRLDLPAADVLRSGGGCLELALPAGSWVDHEAAFDAIHAAETALRAGDHRRAYGPSAVSRRIAGRPFLPGTEGEWVERRRDRLRDTLIRSLECRGGVYISNQEPLLAVELAREAITLAPFRESAYRLLMRAHDAAGNSAEALRAYEACRLLIADELGVPPSPETRAVHAGILGRL